MRIFGKNSMLWLLALLITLLTAYYQRVTGPTYPVSGKVKIETSWIHYKLLRTYGEKDGAPVEIRVKDMLVKGFVSFKRYKSFDTVRVLTMQRKGDRLIARLPHLAPAGKMMYRVVLQKGNMKFFLHKGKTVVLRYKGKVPLLVLIPHIFFMFISLLFAMRATLGAIAYEGGHVRYLSGVVVVCLFFGGLILGPIVQKYAFGAYWTGWPFGHDLTDNKTIFMFLFWVIAWFKLRKNSLHRLWVLIAAAVTIAVYVIPHSAWGSEIDYSKTQATETQQLK